MSNTPKEVLKNIFGYSDFRDNQEAIIQSIIKKNDTLIIMPTGSGKSICYQIPAIIFQGLTIVISPLISLMKDQVEQLRETGVKAEFLNSTLSSDEYLEIIESVKSGIVKLLYVAPETLVLERTINLLKSVQVDCFAVDEAHCISEWGHDFRPEYRKIADLTKNFDNAVVIGATATATPLVQKDIVRNLRLNNPNEFISSFDRKNLFLEVMEKGNHLSDMVNFIKKFPNESGLIYCFSRKQVDELASFLDEEGFSVKPYHAGLSDNDRKRNQELFIRDDVQIVVATVAFGMGINKPNIRFVVHFDLPKDVETYYQQIGRAGRDGLDSHCLLFFGYGDVGKIKYFIGQKDELQQKIAYNHLDAILEFCETTGCRRKSILEYFGEEYHKKNCEKCDNCTQETKQLMDLTIPAQKFLSCIKRTEEMFGANHIVNILRGSKDKKVLQKGHEKLSTYGIGVDIPKKQWLYLERQLLRNKYLIRDDEYGSLKLNENSWKLLRNEDQFFGKFNFEEKKRREVKKDYDVELFDILRKERKVIADAANIPPYIIFSDKSLIEMASFYPQSKKNFMHIYGIGDFKFKKFGDLFIDIIIEYCRSKNIPEQQRYLISKTSSKKKKYIILGEMFNNGANIIQLAKESNIKTNTVVNNLFRYVAEGNKLNRNLEQYFQIDPDMKTKIFKSFNKNGVEKLKPIYTEMNGTVDYETLHFARLVFLSDNTK